MKRDGVPSLDGRNRAIAIAESLARVSAAISKSLGLVGGHISLQNTEISPHRPCDRCVAIRIAQLEFIHVTFVPSGNCGNGLRELTGFRGTLAIGVWRFW